MKDDEKMEIPEIEIPPELKDTSAINSKIAAFLKRAKAYYLNLSEKALEKELDILSPGTRNFNFKLRKDKLLSLISLLEQDFTNVKVRIIFEKIERHFRHVHEDFQRDFFRQKHRKQIEYETEYLKKAIDEGLQFIKIFSFSALPYIDISETVKTLFSFNWKYVEARQSSNFNKIEESVDFLFGSRENITISKLDYDKLHSDINNLREENEKLEKDEFVKGFQQVARYFQGKYQKYFKYLWIIMICCALLVIVSISIIVREFPGLHFTSYLLFYIPVSILCFTSITIFYRRYIISLNSFLSFTHLEKTMLAFILYQNNTQISPEALTKFFESAMKVLMTNPVEAISSKASSKKQDFNLEIASSLTTIMKELSEVIKNLKP
jgi:hypothetical protein